MLAVRDRRDDGGPEPHEASDAELPYLPDEAEREHAEADRAPDGVHRGVTPAKARDGGENAERDGVDGGQRGKPVGRRSDQ